ncbi:hypothetical protein TNCV_1515971 [Trichonephila clavipes]|nr:hypothetical protein TNCV_1515971 [Trichonephila clavipes]
MSTNQDTQLYQGPSTSEPKCTSMVHFHTGRFASSFPMMFRFVPKSSHEVWWNWKRGGRPLTTPRCPPSKLGWKLAKSYCHLYGAQCYG